MRLFIALELPAVSVSAILPIQHHICSLGHGHKTQPENLHITLAFLGETAQLHDAVAAMQTLSFPTLKLVGEGIQCFGSSYYLAIRNTPALMALQSSLVRNLRHVGFSLEERKFIPHVTLCRMKQALPSALDYELDPVFFDATHLTLFQSTFQNRRTVYRPRCTRTAFDSKESGMI